MGTIRGVIFTGVGAEMPPSYETILGEIEHLLELSGHMDISLPAVPFNKAHLPFVAPMVAAYAATVGRDTCLAELRAVLDFALETEDRKSVV